jgi:hypothetical protein
MLTARLLLIFLAVESVLVGIRDSQRVQIDGLRWSRLLYSCILQSADTVTETSSGHLCHAIAADRAGDGAACLFFSR